MARMACCFRNRSCANLEESECLARGGLPYPPVDSLSTSCSGTPGETVDNEQVSCDNQACCYTFDPTQADSWVCSDTLPSACEGGQQFGPFATSLGRGTRCNAITTAGSCHPAFNVPVTCCAPDGTSVQLDSTLCDAMGWAPGDEFGNCPPPPTDDQCRVAGDDVPGPETWTMELCSPAALGVAIVGPNVPNHRKGYGALLTLRKARNLSEQCEHSVSELFLDENRYGQPVFCSRQDRFAPAGRRAHHGTMILQPDSPTPATRVGYGVMASSYDAPDWSEAILGSRLVRCTEELQ